MLFILIFVISTISAKSLPSFIHKCSKSDPNFSSCLDKTVTEVAAKFLNGNKDLGIAVLEPFSIDKVDLGNISSGAVSLHQVYTNMKLYGVTNATVFNSNASFSNGDCYWFYEATGPYVRMESDYKMTGQLLLFPINGHGKCATHIYGVSGKYGATCDRYKKKNKTYIRVRDFTFELKPKKIVFDFENIIDGNELLSREVVKTMNENSDIVYADVGSGFNQVMATVWQETLNQVFSRVPEDELFLP